MSLDYNPPSCNHEMREMILVSDTRFSVYIMCDANADADVDTNAGADGG